MEPPDRAIFVVDDDAGVRRLIATGLRHRFGVHAIPMADAEEALSWARRVRPLLILTDLMMPAVDGAELVRRLKAEPSTADIPVVVMSGGGPEARERALAGGADAFVTKPVHFAQLGSVLGRWLVGFERGPIPHPDSGSAG